MDTIQDLLPNEHFLDFGAGVEKLPDWFGDGSKSLIMGAGDLQHNGMLNVQMFNMFDVFFCKPWDWDGSLRRNMLYLLANHNHEKLLCFVDIGNRVQMDRFTTLFANRFQLIDGHMGHCPHLDFTDMHKVLVEGGQAVNVFESSETCVSDTEFDFWLNNGHFKNMSSIVLTGRIYSRNCGLVLPDEMVADFTKRALNKIRGMARVSVKLSAEVEADLTNMSIHELQQILYALSLDCQLPATLVGTVRPYQRIWRQDYHSEFVIVKRPIAFQEDAVTAYENIYGVDAVVVRIRLLKEAILKDIENGLIWPSQAKFNTLQKYINTNIIHVPESLSA